MLLSLLVLTLNVSPARAQTNTCKTADTVNYPVDTTTFHLVQDYGTASFRHQGRFHTGEDWFGGRDSLGAPVRAMANGRVTYSSPRGWGRDGGAIILEHTLPDGSVLYSQYGHVAESDTVKFPARLTCVEAGAVIAVIGDVRPAPHLHFEIRVPGIGSADNPGAGYTRANPETENYRRPAQMIANSQARLHRAYAWHVTLSTYGMNVPPLVLSSSEMLVIDGGLLRRITNDGRVLYRVPTERPAVSITGYQANPLVTYADGTMGFVDFDGVPGESWKLDFTPDMPPLLMGESLLFHTTLNELVAVAPDRRNFLWWVEGVPPYSRAYVGVSLIALVINQELWLISHNGEIVDKALLRNGADMATYRDGALVVYTERGLWRVNAQGEWSELIPDVPAGGGASAVAITSDGRVYLMDGANLYAYSRLFTLDWQAQLPFPVTGQASMNHYGDILLITSSHGDIIAAHDAGGICGFTRVYGDDFTHAWHDLGSDGILRVGVGDQLLGLNWQRFTQGC